jgi:MFS family permease
VPERAARNVKVFGLTSFLNDTASEMSYWILPAFLTTIGAGPAQLGIIEGIAESVASSTKLFSGYLADRFARRKPLVIAGYAVANAAKPLLGLATSWWHVLLVRFADRTSKGIRQAPRDVMVAESVSPERVGSAFGLLQAMDSAGAIVGPLLALLLVSQLHFSARQVFWSAFIPGALAVIVVTVFARETRIQALAVSGAAQPTLAGGPIPRRFYYTLFAVTLFSLGNSSDMFLILRAQEAGIALTQAPLLGLVFNVVYTATSWPAGRLADRFPKHWIAAAGYGVFALTYFIFARFPAVPAIWAMMALYGLFYSLTNPVLRALIVDTVAPEARGRALGIFYFVTSIATLLASTITGFLWKRFGGEAPLLISASLAVVAALLLLYRPRRA